MQEALTETAQDADAREEMMRFMQAHRERGEKTESFKMHSEGEEEDDQGILEGEQPFEQDLGTGVYSPFEAEKEFADEEDHANRDMRHTGSQASSAPTIPSGKGRLARGDQGLSFPNGKLVDEKIEINQWPSITGFRAWKLSFKKKVAAASRYSQEAFAWIMY